MSLITFLRAIEHRLVGSVERATKPLNKIVARLESVRRKADAAAETAHNAAYSMHIHAFSLENKAVDAAARVKKIAELLG